MDAVIQGSHDALHDSFNFLRRFITQPGCRLLDEIAIKAGSICRPARKLSKEARLATPRSGVTSALYREDILVAGGEGRDKKDLS
jgi:hypothetical protein